jgi:FtsH-binding integral membrane protein
MESNWATEHLQVIRTLMERSALYRRALAPIMLFLGALGLAGGVAGVALRIERMLAFGLFWLGIAAAAVIGAFLLARRQALKDRETFWSPPTRRVAQALLPALFCGLCMSLVLVLVDDDDLLPLFVILCILFYGCSLHAAGFFMPRGMKLFGWGLIGGGLLLLIWAAQDLDTPAHTGHLFMGLFFGLLHLVYGAYLYLTEKGKNAA